MTESNSSSGGLGFSGALTIALIVLKLCHVIDWSWIWVFSPMWISISLIILILIAAKLLQKSLDREFNKIMGQNRTENG